MARLPLEISSQIFLPSLTPFPERATCHVPTLLLNICNAWTDIALSTPALWTTIHVTFPCAHDVKKLSPIWFERVEKYPLSISLEGYLNKDISVIWSHGQQLKDLEIREVEVEDDEYTMTGFTEPVMKLWWRDTNPEPLTSLETLKLRDAYNGWGFSARHVFALLFLLAPNLLECVWHVQSVGLHNVPATKTYILPKLRRLDFGEPGTRPRGGDDIITALTLPALETLSITMQRVDSNKLLAFLKRSSPPLLELVLGKASDFTPLAECLRLVPNLRLFEVWECRVVEELLVALAESPYLLPHLGTLAIHLDKEQVSTISDYFWTALLRALAARRPGGHFLVFGLKIPKTLPASKMPSPDIVAAFKKLAEDGVQICITATLETWNHVFD